MEIPAEAGPSLLVPEAPDLRQNGGRLPLGPFLALTLLVPAAIVIGNFVIGVRTPITLGPEDDMVQIDRVWRFVQSYHVGTDFHDPHGFGPFQVAAILWRLLGPHYYVLRASADLFALVIVLCSCVVAMRQLRHAPGLAGLFCITVAFEASGPSIYGWLHDFGMCLFHDRLLMSALSVLFLQSFANDLDSRRERDCIDLFTAAFLLNVLFLVKISGLVLGLAVVVGGYIVRGRFSRSLANIALVLLFLGVMVATDFVITGTRLSPVIQEYWLAAQARVGSYSVLDALWFASLFPVFGVVVLMVLYAVSRPGSGENLWRCFFIVAFFWVCQVALNMSNSSAPALLFLAPAAAIAVVTWTDTSDTELFSRHLWSNFHPRRLHEISVIEAIPLLIVALVLAPEALTSLRAVKLDYSIPSGTVKPIAVTANKGITFEVFPKDPDVIGFALSINRSIQAIEGLGASRDVIANLDFMNPFPALLLSQSPKGVSVYWDFGNNVPVGYKPGWQEIIGDACIVTEPKHGVEAGYYSKPLIDAVQPHLTSAFTLVYEDELWRIWKNSRCASRKPYP
ncbi:MAG: hypothetical protein WBQ86_05350 [Candidatus Binatus sp.]